ncbi:hypothetical protein ARMSODRAFT_976727 [Armillaria solidipes]|uniref:Uncharacterized protein n=1 Tax=Armillaria solidipes TaxID=1076256 RepID=A0A2H3BCT8_9AGAR|nr:hypothetical protein ARMSODRAFT_976727 [Armillaria solidipes]
MPQQSKGDFSQRPEVDGRVMDRYFIDKEFRRSVARVNVIGSQQTKGDGAPGQRMNIVGPTMKGTEAMRREWMSSSSGVAFMWQLETGVPKTRANAGARKTGRVGEDSSTTSFRTNLDVEHGEDRDAGGVELRFGGTITLRPSLMAPTNILGFVALRQVLLGSPPCSSFCKSQYQDSGRYVVKS